MFHNNEKKQYGRTIRKVMGGIQNFMQAKLPEKKFLQAETEKKKQFLQKEIYLSR